MNIRNLLLERQRSLFVGREEEFAILHQAISDPDWQLIHIHGPGGIGKTTLLRRFAQTLDATRCFYFDGQNGYASPNDFFSHIQAALKDQQASIERLNQYAARHQGILLLIDTFERCAAIENWLMEEFLHQLSPQVKVILAGRYALTDLWLREDWHSLIRNVRLQPLTANEVRQYATIRGISSSDIIRALQRFSKGVPLALSMACEIVVRRRKTSFLEHPEQKQMIGYLAAELMKDIEVAELKKIAEAASIVWKFDQELLQDMLQEDIATDIFRDFCELPFVIRQEDRWTLHDSVRHWIYTDFRSRMPQTYHAYRLRALAALHKRKTDHPNLEAAISFEQIFLHENDFIRNFCFLWEDRLLLRACAKQDMPFVERLYLKHLHYQSNYIAGDPHLESLIQPLSDIDPGDFLGLWKDDRLVAFLACHRLTEQTVRIFGDHPITSRAVSRYTHGRCQYLMTLAGVDPDIEYEMSGSLAHALTKLIDREACIINLLPIQEWGSYLTLLGYERIPWADSSSPGGTPYYAYMLDLRKADWTAKIGRPGANVPTLEEAVKLVQRALKHYSRLPLHPELAGPLSVLLVHERSDLETGTVMQRLQDAIMAILQRFSEGTKEEQRFYRILHYAYIKKTGTHETVAEMLNIPSPSYYRYLKAAVRKLAYELIQAASHRQGR